MVLGGLNARLHARLEGERGVIKPHRLRAWGWGLGAVMGEGKAEERSKPGHCDGEV